jgi:hypothetical protein
VRLGIAPGRHSAFPVRSTRSERELTCDFAFPRSPATRRWSSPDTLAERAHVGTNAGGVHTIVTQTLSTGRTHVNAASDFVADNPDDDIVGEAEPTALVARLDAARIDIGQVQRTNLGSCWYQSRAVASNFHLNRGARGPASTLELRGSDAMAHI